MLASGQQSVSSAEILEVLGERERLQSTGVGGGVAVPHGAIEHLDRQVGALLVCPSPIDFDSIAEHFLMNPNGGAVAFRGATRLDFPTTSHAYDESDCERGGVDTRVDAFRDWVESEMVDACTEGVRLDCENGGTLALPEMARSDWSV